MKHSLISPLFYLGLVFITMGTLFKIQHWPYGRLSQTVGILIELLFFVMVILEILMSKKAARNLKIKLISAYIVLPVVIYLYIPALILIFAIFILGSIYLAKIRKKVLYTRSEIIAQNFDAL